MTHSRLENFTISFFAMFLGLGGFALLFQKAEIFMYFPFHVSNYVAGVTIILFVILLIFFFARWIKYPNAVREEYHHPIKINFFATISIALLIFSIFFLAVNVEISKYLWIIGTVLHLIFTLSVMSAWTNKENLKREHLNPAWFIPIVGNILIPIAGITHFPKDISWFFFSVGIIYWILLFTIILNRIIFHKTLPEKLRPTMFILIAPPAIGFIAYVKLTGTIDSFGKILYFFSLFLFLKLIYQFKIFFKIKFYLSWWAYSFPISALGLASSLMYHKTDIVAYMYISYSFLALLTLVIIILTYKTIIAMTKHELCVPEEE
ncbi:MAG: C4-dicarboxylate ABC transporter [Candidatus Delongbacteria bacterium]|nr:C4-dicarboxylate ABC transporter [Candidatus Delongbacteria bacterium]